MALAYALDYIERNDSPSSPTTASSWSASARRTRWRSSRTAPGVASHGVERWRSDCGCNSGRPSGWNQDWRAPLRDALDWLRDDALAPIFEPRRRMLFSDPWAARDDYIRVILDRSHGTCAMLSSPHHAIDLLDRQNK